MAPENNSTWLQWSKYILEELKTHCSRLDNIDEKLDNHVTHIEHRLTKMEANQKTAKWLMGVILTTLVSTFGVMLYNIIAG